MRPPIPRNISGPILKSKAKSVKFVDDGTVAVSVDLKSSLIPDPVQRQKPLNYHERTMHVLPKKNNLLQYYIEDTEDFVTENKMLINKTKTKSITFNKSRDWNFPPEVYFKDGNQIEYVSEIKLVGVILTEDLKWKRNANEVSYFINSQKTIFFRKNE